ncbi:MAG: hypothetical protein ABR511_10890 [Acidimicrobiales bacterium]
MCVGPRRVGALVVAVALWSAAVGACGGRSTTGRATGTSSTGSSSTGSSSTGSSSTAPRPASATDVTTTSDGNRIRVTVAVGPGSGDPACIPAVAPGTTALPVVVTVGNEQADRAVPFPPVRVELLRGGDPPIPVPVELSPGAACSFTPRVSSLAPGASVAFHGATPGVDTSAAPGSAGRVTASVSESTFAVSVPVP